MADLNLDERELAAGAAVAMDMARQDRRENKAEQRAAPSASAAWMTVAFVAITSIGMLALMLAFAG